MPVTAGIRTHEHEHELAFEQRKFGCERWPLHYAVRTGNTDDLRYLVEVEKKSVNEQDFHDATPLYLAALTGNTEICQYLLEHGANCNPESGGDAARVFYVALTPELRKMLKDWNLSAASRDPYLDVLRKSFNDSTYADCFVLLSSPIESDKTVHDVIDGNLIYLHYPIIYARCPALTRFLPDAKGDELDELKFPSKYRECNVAIYNICQYLYTGKFETRNIETVLIVQDMAKQFNLNDLFEKLDNVLEKNRINYHGNNTSRIKFQILNTDLVKSDMIKLARQVSQPLDESNSAVSCADLLQWSDSTIRCNELTWSLHNFIICAQSEYFTCALWGGFREAKEAFLELSHLVPSSDVVKLAIQWMYCDSFLNVVSLEAAVVILEVGSAILCPRLSIHAANVVLVPAVNAENVFEMLDLALAYNLSKLEDKCVDVFAIELDTLVHKEEFKNMIAREVANTKQLGDILVTDVPIAAEIRSSILKVVTGDDARTEQIRRLKLLRSVVQQSLGFL